MRKYPEDIENAYQSDLAGEKVRVAVECSLFSSLLVTLFGLLDLWAVPSALYTVWSIRAGMLLVSATVLIFTRYPAFFIRNYEPIIAGQMLLFGCAIEAMVIVAHPSDLAWSTYYAGLILVLIAIYAWTYISTRLGAALSTILAGGYLAIALFIQRLDGPLLTTNFFFLAGANLIGFLSKRTRERFSRENYRLKSEMERNLALVEDARQRSEASEEKYRVLFENLEDIFYRTDLAGNLLLWSPYALKVLGYTTEEAQNLNMGRDFYINPAERDEFLRVMKEQGRYEDHEIQVKKKDGTPVWVSTNAHYYRDKAGNILGIEGLSRVITERKRMEEALAASERKYRRLFETLQDAYLRTDLEGNIQMASPSAEKLLGYPLDEIIGKLNLPRDVYEQPEDRNRLTAALADSGSIENFITRFKRRDGTGIWVSANVRLCRDDQGTALEGMVRDITVLKETEEKLRIRTAELAALNARLEQRVQEETEKHMQKEQLLVQQSKLAAMGEMVGVIAHQWRQPLNSIGLIVQQAADAFDQGELDKKEAGQAANAVLDQIEFMSRTIDDFRNFLKPSKEKIPFDVKTALWDVLNILSAQTSHARIRISTHCSCSDRGAPVGSCDTGRRCDLGRLTVNGYPNEFKQSILNVITNAMDAILETRSTAGAGQDTANAGCIGLRTFREDGVVYLQVEDDGGGFPEQIRERMFDPYFTTKGDEKGTGIGLYMAQKIIEANMDGTLSAENGRHGAVFTVRFPAATRQDVAAAQFR